jgi:hypothetical protein
LNIMNFTTMLCKCLSVKELVTNVPIHESITGNACFLPEHCFFLYWLSLNLRGMVLWCLCDYESITGNVYSFPEHCFVCIFFFEFGTIGFSWKNSLRFYDFIIRFYDPSLFCIFRAVSKIRFWQPCSSLF